MSVQSAWRELGGLVQTIVVALAVAMVPRVVLCQPFTIPSSSMEPTLLVGDYVLVTKYPYGWSRHSIPFSPPLPAGRLLGHEPRRGDIVVFKQPRDGKDLIKRLIGLPGDRVQVKGGALLINGAPVPRQMLATGYEDGPFGQTEVQQFHETLPNGRGYTVNSWGADTPAGSTGVYVVPAGCYFMLGDNRDNSLDSRFDPGPVSAGESRCPWDASLDSAVPQDYGVGFVPFDDLVGRAEIVLVSWKPGAALTKPWTWVDVRWDRLFHPVEAGKS